MKKAILVLSVFVWPMFCEAATSKPEFNVDNVKCVLKFRPESSATANEPEHEIPLGSAKNSEGVTTFSGGKKTGSLNYSGFLMGGPLNSRANSIAFYVELKVEGETASGDQRYDVVFGNLVLSKSNPSGMIGTTNLLLGRPPLPENPASSVPLPSVVKKRDGMMAVTCEIPQVP